MNKCIILAASMALTLGLSACAQGPITKQDVGAVSGGILGGAVGSQFGSGTGKTVSIIAGTLLGGLLGGAIGKSMDDVDRMKMNQTLESTPTNSTTTWSNPDGNSYRMTPTRTYTNSSGQPCRQFTTTAVIDGKSERINGTACRASNGQWKIVS